MTRLASVTATGDVGGRPAAAAAATAGQSMHQMASTRERHLREEHRQPHPPTACTDPKDRPLARMANRTRLIRPHPGVGLPPLPPVTS